MNDTPNKRKFFLHISLLFIVLLNNTSVCGGRGNATTSRNRITHHTNSNHHQSISRRPSPTINHRPTHFESSHQNHHTTTHSNTNFNDHRSHSSIPNDQHNANRSRNRRPNVAHNSHRNSTNGNNQHRIYPNRNAGRNVTSQSHRNPSHSQVQHKLPNQNQRRNTTHYSPNRFSNGNNHSISNSNQNKRHNVTHYPQSHRSDQHKIPNHNRVHNVTQQPHRNQSHLQDQHKLSNREQRRNMTHVSHNKFPRGNNHSMSYPNRNREHNITHYPHSDLSNWNDHPKSNFSQNKSHNTTHPSRNNFSNKTDHSKLHPDRTRDHNITHRPINNLPIRWNVNNDTHLSNNLPIGWNANDDTRPSNKLPIEGDENFNTHPIGWNINTDTRPNSNLPIGWNINTDTRPNNNLPIGWNENTNTRPSSNSPIEWNIDINTHPSNKLPNRPVNPDTHPNVESNKNAVFYPSRDDSIANEHTYYNNQPDQTTKQHRHHRPHYHNRDRKPHQDYSSLPNKTLLNDPNSAIEKKLIREDELSIPRTICGKTLCSYVLNYPTDKIEDAVSRAQEILPDIIRNSQPRNQNISPNINLKNNAYSFEYNKVSNAELVNGSGLCRKYINEISPLEGFSSEDGIMYHIVNVPSFAQTLISIECDSSNGLTCGQTVEATVLQTRSCQQLYREDKLVVLPIGKRYYEIDDFHLRTVHVPADCSCIVHRKGL